MSVLAALELAGATTALVALPLAPALRELLYRADAAPLPTRCDEGDIRSFARSFRARIAPAMPLLAEAAERGETLTTLLEDGTRALVVGGRGACEGPVPADLAMLCASDVYIPAESRFLRELYVHGKLFAGHDSVFRALLVEGDAELSERAIVLRWMHAQGRLSAGAHSQFHGRLSADGDIQLALGCRFERVSAKVIVTGMGNGLPAQTRPVWAPGKSIIDQPMGRLRTAGDLHLAAGDGFCGHLISRRSIRIDEGVQVMGSMKSHGATWLGKGAQVHGAVVSESEVRVAGGCFIRGPLLCESDLIIGRNTQIGTPDSPTTVSAPRIQIASDAVLHGSIWAREHGEVQEQVQE